MYRPNRSHPRVVWLARLFALLVAPTILLAACKREEGMVVPKFAESITVTPSTTEILQGEVASFTATARYSNGSIEDVSSQATWTSSDVSVADLVPGGGGFEGLRDGTVTILASFESRRAEAGLEVHGVLDIVASAPSDRIQVDESLQLTVEAITDVGRFQVTTPVTYTSSDPTRATVDDIGVVTGLSVGDVSIDASAYDWTRSTRFMVFELESLTISPDVGRVDLGAVGRFAAEATTTDGFSFDATKAATWSSSSESVARPIASTPGVFETLSEGSVEVTAELRGRSGEATLEVRDPTTAPATHVLFGGEPPTGRIWRRSWSWDETELTELSDVQPTFSYQGFYVRGGAGGGLLIRLTAEGFPATYRVHKYTATSDPPELLGGFDVTGPTSLLTGVKGAPDGGHLYLTGPDDFLAFEYSGNRATTPLDGVGVTALDVGPLDASQDFDVAAATGGPTPLLRSMTYDASTGTYAEASGSARTLFYPAELVVALSRVVFVFGFGGVQAFLADGMNTPLGAGPLWTEPVETADAVDGDGDLATVLWKSPADPTALRCTEVDVVAGTARDGPLLQLAGEIRKIVFAPDGMLFVLFNDGTAQLRAYDVERGCSVTELGTVQVPPAYDFDVILG